MLFPSPKGAIQFYRRKSALEGGVTDQRASYPLCGAQSHFERLQAFFLYRDS